MRRQDSVFPKGVSSIVSSHQLALRTKVSLTLTDNWWFCILVDLYIAKHAITGETRSRTSVLFIAMECVVLPGLKLTTSFSKSPSSNNARIFSNTPIHSVPSILCNSLVKTYAHKSPSKSRGSASLIPLLMLVSPCSYFAEQ